jgi:uncharacterized protein (DUF1800 family)
MTWNRIYKRFIAGVFLTLVFAFSEKGAENAHSVRMPYKKYGYTDKQAAARLLDRFSFGAKPGEVDAVVKVGLDKWVEQQLTGNLADDEVNTRLANYKTLSLNNETIVNTYLNPGQLIRFAAKNGLINRDSLQGDKKEYQGQVRMLMQQMGLRPLQELQGELINQKIIRAAYSNNQLHQVLTDFWFNHFNVSLTKPQCVQFIQTYERDAIRPHVVGNFSTLLNATAKHPAMLEFLDNASSISDKNTLVNKRAEAVVQKQLEKRADDMQASGSKLAPFAQQAAQAKKVQGLNENYAREIMELHTLGVDGGYTQADVTAVARALTGWGVRPLIKDAPGRNLYERGMQNNFDNRGFVVENDFFFRADKHDDEAKIILGKNFSANGGYKEGEEVLTMLANHPSTAQFIAKKLAIRFVSDTPATSLVNKMAETFRKTGGNIKAVLITMVNDPSFWNQQLSREKVKSPFELAISTIRATNADIRQPGQVFNWVTKMGQKIYFYQAPTGFPDRASYWINTGALLNRMNFGLAFASQKIPGVKIDLAALNNNHEPESAEDALKVYSAIFLPERDHTQNIKRLTAMVADKSVADKINAAAEKNNSQPIPSAPGNNSMMAQVAGIIIGSPEFQRK